MADLQTLSRQTNEQSLPPQTVAHPSRVPAPRRKWFTRLMLPGAIALSLLALLAYATRDLILPAAEVSVVRASAIPASAPGNEAAHDAPRHNAVVAQAPGWVEPDPYPIYVTTLADGVVDTIHVLEGDRVTKGQPLLTLVDDDAALSVEQAKAALDRARATLAAAQTDLDEPVALLRSEAVARARLAESHAALTRLDAQVEQEAARLAELEAAYTRLAAMDGRSVSDLQVEAAQYQAQSQRAVVEATRQRRPGLEAMVEAAAAEHHAAQRELELKTALIQARDEAAATASSAATRLAQAELRLERMSLASPADGIVMRRLVGPGDKLMLGMDDKHSAHAIHLYDPAALQVRVDVPLADAAAVGAGQQATVIVDVLPDVSFRGIVTRVVHQADLAKNTVQFKVAITDPSPLLKPDMLARVKFLGQAHGSDATGSPGTASAGSDGAPVALQRSAIVGADSDEPFVWWVSPTDQRIARRGVTLGQDREPGWVTIRAGLNPGDVIVDSPAQSLREGQRVRTRPAKP